MLFVSGGNMALTFTNDSASISTTEYSLPNDSTTLTPQTTDGVYQFFIDFANMVAGDQYVVQLKEKYDSTGTQRLIEEWIFTGAQSKPMFVSPSLILGEGWDITVKRLAGSDRTIAWSIRKAA
jgi:hypothetical protein